jgi:hypothetical protein
MPPLYLRDDQHAALRALSADGSRADVLLCNSFLGSYAPWVAGTRVYVGHWAETLRFRQKQRELARFLEAGTPDASREAFCRREGITHVLRDRSVYDELYYSPPAGDPGPGFQPKTSAWLALIFEQDRVALYRVRPQD